MHGFDLNFIFAAKNFSEDEINNPTFISAK